MSTSPDLVDAVVDFVLHENLYDPAPLYHRMIDEEPVLFCPIGEGYWIVSSHELARVVLTAKDEFVRGGKMAFDRRGRGDAVRAMISVSMVQIDEPDHTRLRSIVSRAFTPRAVERLRTQAEGIVERKLAELDAAGAMDVVHDFAYPYTVEIIASMLGLPLDDGPRLVAWTHAITPYLMPNATDDDVERADRAATEMSEYFLRFADQRREGAADDMIGALAQAEESGDRLSRSELAAMCFEMVGAGHETTASQIPNGVFAFLRHPDQLALLREQPELMPSAVEECLRYEGPLRSPNPLVASADVELGGKVIPAGSRVMVWVSAANRDPAVFRDPDRFDITRTENRHLAFSSGIHFCLGAALARMETATALAGILALPDVALADPEPPWRKRFFGIRALETLPVRWRGGT